MNAFDFAADFEAFLALNGKEHIKRTSKDGSQCEYLFEQQRLIIRLVPIACYDQKSPIPVSASGPDTLYLYEDRWRSGGEVLKARILARLGTFKSLFARKCRILTQEEFGRLFRSRSLPDALLAQIAQLGIYDGFMRRCYCAPDGLSAAASGREARLEATLHNIFNHITADFLQRYHSYGAAKCKYRIALLCEGVMVAVATFSEPLRMTFGVENREEALPSFEWVRYASLPGVRIAGGMGRMLGEFCRSVARQGLKQFEVMTYSDNEWSNGAVYEQLGFEQVAERRPVEYFVDTTSWQRYNRRQYRKLISDNASCLNFVKITNLGSRKFILRKIIL